MSHLPPAQPEAMSTFWRQIHLLWNPMLKQTLCIQRGFFHFAYVIVISMFQKCRWCGGVTRLSNRCCSSSAEVNYLKYRISSNHYKFSSERLLVPYMSPEKPRFSSASSLR
jgi:hypothetical protein